MAPLAKRHKSELAIVIPYLGDNDGCIWLYRRRMNRHKLFGMAVYVAINHNSHRIVRLKVEYDDWQAASWRALQDLHEPEDVTVALTHDYTGAGPFGHYREPIELLTTPVEPERIHLVNSWNLLQFVHGHNDRRQYHQLLET